MPPRDYFSADYFAARGRFRDAAARAGARLERYVNPAPGPDGEELTTDVAWLGPKDAGRVLVTISATHGGEGFCGSGLQVGWFESGLAAELPVDTALLAIHALNPYGFAWIRRVSEDNVDLNRNFVDFAKPLPENPGYDELAEWICPAEWSDAALAASAAVFEAYAKRHGTAALQRAVSGGQYRHPHGVFYGGSAPTWSRRTLERIVADFLQTARHVATIDYHTGLGPWGHGEMIVTFTEGAPLERARRWYGAERISIPALGSSASADVAGDSMRGFAEALPTTSFTGMALEYGTLPFQDVLNAIRADAWLHRYGDPRGSRGREMKRAIRDTFYGDRDDWKATVYEQGVAAQRRALAGLAEEA
jgi:hypothetical protein